MIGTPYTGTHAPGANGAGVNWQSDNAIDIGVPAGTPVYAAADGVVGGNVGVQPSRPRDGARVQINSPDNAFWYGHLSRVVVKPGQRVRKGQLIGYSGVSQNGAAHLHIGVERGNPVDMFGYGNAA